MPLVTRFYVDQPSLIHSLDARVKIIWAAVIFLAVMTFNDPLYQSTIFFSILAVAILGKLSLTELLSRIKAIIPLGIWIALMWSVFEHTGTVLFRFWIIKITDIGLLYGIGVGLRVISLVFVLFVVLMSTDQAEILYGLISLKMPYNFAFIITAIFRFVPTISGEADTIREAQITRAMDFDSGSIFERIRKSTSFMIPLIIRVLKTTMELSIAITSKAYGAYPNRTFHRQRILNLYERAIIIVLLGCEILFVFMRLVLGWGAVIPGSI